MKKRLLAAILVCIMVICLVPATAMAGTNFEDVKADAYYAKPVEWAVGEGITNGTSTTTFSPDNTCTRAQIITFLWRAAGEPAPKTTANAFTDVAESDYFYTAVNWAAERGILPKSDKLYPNAPCTRGDTVTYMWRTAGSPTPELVNFADVTGNNDLAKAVAWAVRKGITNGTSSTTFTPDQTCTRGQIVTFLYRDFVEAIEVVLPEAPKAEGSAKPITAEKLDPLPPKQVTKQPDWYISLTPASEMSNDRLVAEHQNLCTIWDNGWERTEQTLIREGDLQREISNRIRAIDRYTKYPNYYEEGYLEVLKKGDITNLVEYYR